MALNDPTLRRLPRIPATIAAHLKLRREDVLINLVEVRKFDPRYPDQPG
jgi:hypothetical protein